MYYLGMKISSWGAPRSGSREGEIAMINKLVLDRFIEAAPDNVRLVLLFCDLSFVICQGKKTLSIKCPNSFASDPAGISPRRARINNAIFAGMGQRINTLGIEVAALVPLRGTLFD